MSKQKALTILSVIDSLISKRGAERVGKARKDFQIDWGLEDDRYCSGEIGGTFQRSLQSYDCVSFDRCTETKPNTINHPLCEIEL